MKKCKYCMSEIDDKAKICPHCGKRQKRSVIKTILSCIFLLFVVLVIIAIVTGGGDKDEAGIMTMDKVNAIQNGMRKSLRSSVATVSFQTLPVTASIKLSSILGMVTAALAQTLMLPSQTVKSPARLSWD